MMYLSSHVDDVLVSYSSEAIRARFDDALRTFFGKMPNGEDRVTGGDSEVREYLGIAVERDRMKKTITLHQYPFIRKLLDSFNSHRLRQGRSAPLDDNSRCSGGRVRLSIILTTCASWAVFNGSSPARGRIWHLRLSCLAAIRIIRGRRSGIKPRMFWNI